MPDPSTDERCAPASPIDAAQVLEDAADLLLIRGVERTGSWGVPGEKRCAIGAIAEATHPETTDLVQSCAEANQAMYSPAGRSLKAAVRSHAHFTVMGWNDDTTDDFEVIDTLRRVAKDLRNEATA